MAPSPAKMTAEIYRQDLLAFIHRSFLELNPAKTFQYNWHLALLWQIYSRRRALQIHFWQCGHRCGGGRATSSRMAWRTAGKVG